MTIQASTFLNNSVRGGISSGPHARQAQGGGGIYATWLGTLSVDSSAFMYNYASDVGNGGPAICMLQSEPSEAYVN